jgi:hypothetical protein
MLFKIEGRTAQPWLELGDDVALVGETCCERNLASPEACERTRERLHALTAFQRTDCMTLYRKDLVL